MDRAILPSLPHSCPCLPHGWWPSSSSLRVVTLFIFLADDDLFVIFAGGDMTWGGCDPCLLLALASEPRATTPLRQWAPPWSLWAFGITEPIGSVIRYWPYFGSWQSGNRSVPNNIRYRPCLVSIFSVRFR
jgi:hypothetical protein